MRGGMSERASGKRQVVVLILVSLLFLAIGVAVTLPLFHSEDKAATDASYNYLRKGTNPPSLLPDDLAATIVKEKEAWVANGPVTEKQLAEFARAHKPVDQLKLRSSDVGAQELAALKDCGLTLLRVHNSDLDREALQTLSSIESLRGLVLDDNRMTTGFIRSLTGPAGLKSLAVSRNEVDRRFLEHLQRAFPALEVLDLSRTLIKSEDLAVLTAQPKLLKLRLYGCPNISAADAAALRKKVPKLTVYHGDWRDQWKN